MKKVLKTNTKMVETIDRLTRSKKGIWRKVAHELSKPRRTRVEVNVSKVELYAKDGATILVPGKVLGSGAFTKKVTIAAFSFSDGARKALAKSGSHVLSIEDLAAKNPEGKDVFILV